MSRSLGLREDQCWKDELVTRIIGFLPVEPRWCIREQARSHRMGVFSLDYEGMVRPRITAGRARKRSSTRVTLGKF